MASGQETSDSASRAINLLGERWTFLILRQAFFGTRRFNELRRTLNVGPTMLGDRLKKLVDSGILERNQYRASPDFYEYRLTEKGRALYPAVRAFTAWGDRYLLDGQQPPLVFRHKPCGSAAPPQLICSDCGLEIDALDVEVEVYTSSSN
jgi:DNA-binding HxlR family transcriptional regulator